jgi:ABC-type antimicrobial peptide transport system ATPase subunit
MERGRVIESGNPGGLLADPQSVYAKLHAAHFTAGVIRG